MVHRVLPEFVVLLEPLEVKELAVALDLQDQREILDHQDLLVHKVHQELKEQLEQLVPQVQRVI